MNTTCLLSPFALSLLALAPAGCAHKPTIVGKWQGTVAQPNGTMSSTFEFAPDGKETISGQVNAGAMTMALGVSGTYTVDGANLTQTLTTMTMNGRAAPLPARLAKPAPFKLDGDHLTLTNPAAATSLALTRVKE